MNEEKKIILILEDEEALRNVIIDKLEVSGFKTASVDSVEAAIEKVHELKHVDAVWLDHYLLGNKTGLDFLAHIKAHGETENIPVFVVTNTGTHEKEVVYLELGAEKYYIKSNKKLDDIVNDISEQIQKNGE